MLSTTLRAGLVLTCVASLCSGDIQYGFYRSTAKGDRRTGDAQRVFGGAPASMRTFSAACVIFDYDWNVRCSAAVLAPFWVLTAGHCVSSEIAYVKYNSRNTASSGGDICGVKYRYRHPDFKVEMKDEGRGMDITELHHDVGLLRTEIAMELDTPLAMNPLDAMFLYNLRVLKGQEVQVLGFGLTERSSTGEELFEVRLQLVFCKRRSYMHCMCGESKNRAGNTQGVCSGDSGGPVLFRGVQVGITSMGPQKCVAGVTNATGIATSVFTSLHQYANMINNTVHDSESAARMSRVITSPGQSAGSDQIASSDETAGASQLRGAALALAAGAGAALLARPSR